MYGDVYQITWEGKMHNPDGKPYSSGAVWRIKALLSECCFYIRGWPEGRDSSSSACSQLDTRWTEVWTGPCNDNSLSFKGERQHVRFDGGGHANTDSADNKPTIPHSKNTYSVSLKQWAVSMETVHWSGIKATKRIQKPSNRWDCWILSSWTAMFDIFGGKLRHKQLSEQIFSN